MWLRSRFHIPFLITGHPRCGTTSAGSVCRSMNLDIGDEAVGRHGACSWMLAVDDKWSPYGGDKLGRSRRNLRWDWLILVVRDLQTALPSVIVENRHAAPSLAYRRKHILKQLGIDIAKSPDEFTAALRSVICWVRIIARQSPDLTFRIEDQQHELRKFVTEKLGIGLQDVASAAHIHDNADKFYGEIKPQKPDVSASNWQNLTGDLKADVDWYCSTFGYTPPYERI